MTAVSLPEAARRLGVHYMTVYRYIRLGSLPARKEGGAWVVDAADLQRLKSSKARTANRASPRVRTAPWDARFKARVASGDEAGAWAVVEAALAAGRDTTYVYVDVIAPALRALGRDWATGRIDVSAEHRATTTTARVIARLGARAARRGRKRATILLGCIQGELHSLPLALVADVLRAHGFDVTDLGADTPAASFVVAAEEQHPSAIGVSTTDRGLERAARRTLRWLRAAVGRETPILMGGGAIEGLDHARALGADGWAPDARGAAAAFADLVAGRPGARSGTIMARESR